MAADLIVRDKVSVFISGATIESIRPYDSARGAPIFGAGENPVLPGLFDTHVHIKEPGRCGLI